MSSVLIAGCGYVGTAAANLFAAAGWTAVGWTAKSTAYLENGISKAVDISDSEAVRRNCFPADVVVHCAGVPRRDPESYERVYYTGSRNLLNHFPNAYLIFTSSTAVYAQSDGSWVDERMPAEPTDENGRILRETEEMVLKHGGTVLRLGGIYGPARSFLLRSVLNHRSPPSPDRFVNQIHRDDAAAAIFFAAGHESKCASMIYNVVDDLPVLRSEILHWLSEQLSAPLATPASAEGGLTRSRTNKRVRNGRLRDAGWIPAYPDYRQAFGQSILPSFNLSAPSGLSDKN